MLAHARDHRGDLVRVGADLGSACGLVCSFECLTLGTPPTLNLQLHEGSGRAGVDGGAKQPYEVPERITLGCDVDERDTPLKATALDCVEQRFSSPSTPCEAVDDQHVAELAEVRGRTVQPRHPRT